MIMFWCGVTSIAHLCVISIERCVTMSNPMWSVANRGKIPLYVGAMVIFCWAFGLFWAVLPLVGRTTTILTGNGIYWFEVFEYPGTALCLNRILQCFKPLIRSKNVEFMLTASIKKLLFNCQLKMNMFLSIAKECY